MTAFPDISPHSDPETLRAESLRFANRLHQLQQYPFGREDTSAGMEYELQVAVEGLPEQVDSPRTIRNSSFYRNTEKRAARGDLPKSSFQDLQDFLDGNSSAIWENSWGRFDLHLLGQFASQVLATDFRADKNDLNSPLRKDLHRFKFREAGREMVRIPISYLLKLSLADILDPVHSLPPAI